MPGSQLPSHNKLQHQPPTAQSGSGKNIQWSQVPGFWVRCRARLFSRYSNLGEYNKFFKPPKKRKVLACWWPTVVHSLLPSAVLACGCCSSRISVHCTPMHVCTVYCTQWCTHCACACVQLTVCRMPASSCGLCAVCFPLRPGNKKRNLPVELYNIR